MQDEVKVEEQKLISAGHIMKLQKQVHLQKQSPAKTVKKGDSTKLTIDAKPMDHLQKQSRKVTRQN